MTKLAIIVGMGPGVSAAVARRFGREGFHIAAIARRADAIKSITADLSAAGIRATGYTADAGSQSALQTALAQIADTNGAADVLVYNAAGVRFKPLTALTSEELAADLSVSVGGALTAALAVLPAMKARERGTLLFTGGGFAIEPNPSLASLGIGKAGLRNLAYCLFAGLKDSGVHAATVTICGTVKTGTAFDPDRIAECYWKLHAQPKGSFEREIMFSG